MYLSSCYFQEFTLFWLLLVVMYFFHTHKVKLTCVQIVCGCSCGTHQQRCRRRKQLGHQQWTVDLTWSLSILVSSSDHLQHITTQGPPCLTSKVPQSFFFLFLKVHEFTTSQHVKINGLISSLVCCTRDLKFDETAVLVTGAAQMYENGVLAYVDVKFLADVHIRAFEDVSACGRYFCFNQIVNTEEEALKLVESLSPLIPMPPRYILLFFMK